MLIQILIDNPDSWILPYAKPLVEDIKREFGHQVNLIYKPEQVVPGDILFLLACEKIFRNLDLNKHNLVVHESYLPRGKGWSPVTWQVLEGKNVIPVTLFEATEKVDAGEIYSQNFLTLKGNELLPEIKEKQGIATVDIIMEFLRKYPKIERRAQVGDESFYPRRTPNDSKLEMNKSIEEQFNLLRVCDNERYPAFFNYKGRKYILKIFAEDE